MLAGSPRRSTSPNPARPKAQDRQERNQGWCLPHRRRLPGRGPRRQVRLLAQLGITPQKPLYRAIERDETLVNKWLKTEYPKIGTMAKAQGADIYFGDAAHIRSDHHAGRTWGKKGVTPVVATTGARYAMSLISAITSKGHMRFMVKPTGGVNADVFIEFLKRLLVGATRRIFLIVDRPDPYRTLPRRPGVCPRHGIMLPALLFAPRASVRDGSASRIGSLREGAVLSSHNG